MIDDPPGGILQPGNAGMEEEAQVNVQDEREM